MTSFQLFQIWSYQRKLNYLYLFVCFLMVQFLSFTLFCIPLWIKMCSYDVEIIALFYLFIFRFCAQVVLNRLENGSVNRLDCVFQLRWHLDVFLTLCRLSALMQHNKTGKGRFKLQESAVRNSSTAVWLGPEPCRCTIASNKTAFLYSP